MKLTLRTYFSALLCSLIILTTTSVAQIQLAFQGGEPGDDWEFISSGADATAQAQAFLMNNIVSGTQSIVVGGNTPGGSCIDGGTGNGPSVARFFTFETIDISSSSDFFRTLTFHWGSRHPICVGTGWDTGENLVFTAYHDGVAQPSETLAVGFSDANFSIQDHSHTHTIPPCVNEFYFHITINTNRRDELLFLDDVLLSTPQFNVGGGLGTNVNLNVCETELPYNWNGLIFTQAGTQSITLTNSFGCDSIVNYILSVETPSIPQFPTFGPYCSGSNIQNLPTTSTNGINGTWSPAINNQQTTTYTFTPNANQCASEVSTSITINPNIDPTFTLQDSFCAGATIPPLPIVSSNNISGTWSPAINNNTTTTYTFVPSSNQAGVCANTLDFTIVIQANIEPLFEDFEPICEGANINALPTSSLNGINGTWSPALNNIETTTYTFTPNAGQCANSTSKIIFVEPQLVPEFNPPGTYCVNSEIPPLPTSSMNGINGTWSPAINNTSTTTYTFEPESGTCATTTEITIQVADAFTPIFNFDTTHCQGAPIPALPSPSNNGINGTWSPALNNTTTTTYTFTPQPNQCATDAQVTLVILPNVTPEFNAVGPYCAGTEINALPTLSNNGIEGIWTPVINNQATTTYSFQPNTNQCALTTSLSIEIQPIQTPIFDSPDSFCMGDNIPNLPNNSLNGITGTWSPEINNQETTTYLFSPEPEFCSDNTNLTISVNPLDTTHIQTIMCDSELPFIWNGLTINDTGTYDVNFINSSGCDSTVILQLQVVSNTVINQEITICHNDFPYTFFDQQILVPGVYEHSTSHQFGCDTSFVLEVSMHPDINVAFNEEPIIVCNEPVSATFSVSATHQISNCVWAMHDQNSTNCDSFSVDLSEIGCYNLQLEATDMNGCSVNLLAENMVCIHPNPIASFSLNNNFVESGEAVQPTNESIGASDFIWDFGDESPQNSSANPQHIYNESGGFEITLEAISPFGCSDTFSALISVAEAVIVYVPNTFTPGEGNLNLTFQPVISSGVNPYAYRLLIFNRWGEVLFESLNPAIGWNGTYGNKICPSDTYLWQIEYQSLGGNNNVLRGHVNLLK